VAAAPGAGEPLEPVTGESDMAMTFDDDVRAGPGRAGSEP